MFLQKGTKMNRTKLVSAKIFNYLYLSALIFLMQPLKARGYICLIRGSGASDIISVPAKRGFRRLKSAAEIDFKQSLVISHAGKRFCSVFYM